MDQIQVRNDGPIIYYVQERHFRLKDTNSLKVKRWKKCGAKRNQKGG